MKNSKRILLFLLAIAIGLFLSIGYMHQVPVTSFDVPTSFSTGTSH